MNKKQRIVLFIGITIFLLMGLFPPYVSTVDLPDRFIIHEFQGYYPIIYNPHIKPGNIIDYQYEEFTVTEIEISRLVIQWITVVVTTGGLILLFNPVNLKKYN